jgi:hypothetical protein
MKTVIFDPFSGASGDMIMGGLLDLGAKEGAIKSAMENINVKVDIERTERLGIGATKINVTYTDDEKKSYDEVVNIIERSGLKDDIINDAIHILKKITNAEANVHDTHILHEIGSLDLIADIIGSCVAFHDLGLKGYDVRSTYVSLGGGFVETEEGRLPVPAPATVQILMNSVLVSQGGPVPKELLTPTGAAILSHFVKSCDRFLPQMRIERVGYGAGSRELEIPNVLRMIIGELDDSLILEEIGVLETNVDDVTGEIMGNLIEELMEMGAKDVCIIPAMRKKGRSGYIIQAIAPGHLLRKIAMKMIEETGSLGVRVSPIKHRLIAQREIERVSIDIGGAKREIRVKIAKDMEGRILNIAAEFEDAKKVAREFKIPLKTVMRMAEEVAWRR